MPVLVRSGRGGVDAIRIPSHSCAITNLPSPVGGGGRDREFVGYGPRRTSGTGLQAGARPAKEGWRRGGDGEDPLLTEEGWRETPGW